MTDDPSPRADHERRRYLVWFVLVGIVLPILLLAGCTTAVVVAATSAFRPHQRVGFTVGRGSCSVDPASGEALVQLPMRSGEDGAKAFNLLPLGNKDIALLGIEALPEGKSVAGLGGSAAAVIHAQIADPDDRPDWGRVTGKKPTNLVFRFHKKRPSSSIELSKLVLWWGPGEVSWVQDVPLDLVWSGSSCTVKTG